MKKLTTEQTQAIETVTKSKRLGFTKTDLRRMTYGMFDSIRGDLKGSSKLASAFITAYFALHN